MCKDVHTLMCVCSCTWKGVYTGMYSVPCAGMCRHVQYVCKNVCIYANHMGCDWRDVVCRYICICM